MSTLPTSLSSIAPAGLFYSYPALADGGNRLLSSDLPLIARCVSHERRDFFV
jgi:hypothetical protein